MTKNYSSALMELTGTVTVERSKNSGIYEQLERLAQSIMAKGVTNDDKDESNAGGL